MRDLLSLVSEYQPVRGEGERIRIMRRPGARIDLHCHTTFSNERLRYLPGLVFHPLLTPAEVYDLAKARGMDFVTITDHDTIDGCLDLVDDAIQLGAVPSTFHEVRLLYGHNP